MGFISWFRSKFSGSFTGAHNEPGDSLSMEVSASEMRDFRETALARVAAAYDMAQEADAKAKLKAEYEARWISEHFTWDEVACRDKDRTRPTGHALASAQDAASMMEGIRYLFGDRPITVNSWYRTPEYNRQVGGAKNSMHMQGHAVDFTVEGLTPTQVFAKLRAARDSGKIKIGGLGKYPRWVHADLGKTRTWNG